MKSTLKRMLGLKKKTQSKQAQGPITTALAGGDNLNHSLHARHEDDSQNYTLVDSHPNGGAKRLLAPTALSHKRSSQCMKVYSQRPVDGCAEASSAEEPRVSYTAVQSISIMPDLHWKKESTLACDNTHEVGHSTEEVSYTPVQVISILPDLDWKEKLCDGYERTSDVASRRPSSSYTPATRCAVDSSQSSVPSQMSKNTDEGSTQAHPSASLKRNKNTFTDQSGRLARKGIDFLSRASVLGYKVLCHYTEGFSTAGDLRARSTFISSVIRNSVGLW